MSQEKKQCPVCYEDLTIENAVNLPCNHSQCSKCFWKWTNDQGKQSCCMCRSEYLTHKNHQLNANVEEANNALEWARRSLAECMRREEQIRLKVEDLYDEEVHKQELIENLQHIYNHEKAKLDKLEIIYYHRIKECCELGCSLPSEGHKMTDDMLSLFYERRHKKRLDIAQKKRDGRYKKVLAELNDYIEWERRTKISLKANCIHFVHEILEIKRGTTGWDRGSAWIFEEDETNYGFYVTQAQTTMKPVYADIRVDKSSLAKEWLSGDVRWVWSAGNYERKIVNWLKPDDYADPNWNKNELLYFRKWHRRLMKALRLTRDIKTEKGHRERNIDVEENRITKMVKSSNWKKIKVVDLGEFGMSMFDEPPAFAGDETRLSLCMWTEYDGPNHGIHRPVLEEGEIDEIGGFASDTTESTSGTDTGSDTGSGYSSMPELIDENGNIVEDELEYTRTENVEESMRLWRELTSGNVSDEDVERHVHRLADLAETFILQE